jgi:hypothetical protein
MKKYFLSYGTSYNSYSHMRDKNAETFLKFNNFDRYFLLDENSINKDYYFNHRDILTSNRGAGYWLWKPYLINKVLSTLEYNDILMYCDSSISQVASLDSVLSLLKERDIITFIVNDGNGDEREVCKRDALILLDCDREYIWQKPLSGQLGASYIFLRKTKKTVEVVKEWLEYCEDERIISDKENVLGKPNYPMFVDHRHDQAVLSLLCKKHNITPIYDITQYGNEFRTESWGQMLYHGR